ncbi:MAG: pilus assembly protein [Parvularculaceae bacterium]
MRVFGKFTRDENGNIAILYAFTLVLLLLFAGGAVDFSRRNAIKADLIESLDAAGLAVAQLDEANGPEISGLNDAQRKAYLKDYGVKFFNENFSHENEILNLNVDFDITEQKITPRATGRIKTLLLGAASALIDHGAADDLKMMTINSDTEITRKGSGPIELALVLDVTGSMDNYIGGERKIDSLKDAADALLDSLYGADANATSNDVTTSVVPFAAWVNSGGAKYDDGTSAWSSSWGDTLGLAYYNGAHFFHVDNSGAIDLTKKVNHFDLWNSLSGSETWDGCNEERPYPFDEIDIPAGATPVNSDVSGFNTAPTGTTNSRMLQAFSNAPTRPLSDADLLTVANTKFVPQFAPDDPDCDGNACDWGSTTSGSRRHRTTTWNSYTAGGLTYYGHWFKDPDDDGSDAWKTSSSVRESDYDNSFIDDDQYTTASGSGISKYVKVLNYARRNWLNFSGEPASSDQSNSNTECGATPNSGVYDPSLQSWLTSRGATECGDGDEYILRQGYVGWWNPSTFKYEGKYNLSTNVSSSRTPNQNCPAASILYSSNDKKKIHDFVQTLSPGGNTDSAEGMMWGWRTVSPGAPFVSPHAYDDSKWQKAVVLMTDGFNTFSSARTNWGTEMSPFGFGREARMGANIDSASEMRDEIDNKLLRICARMKEKGILVYTVTFGLSDSGSEGDTKDVFKACATDDEAPYYFDAPSGQDLKDAFADIASDLVKLHVSR